METLFQVVLNRIKRYCALSLHCCVLNNDQSVMEIYIFGWMGLYLQTHLASLHEIVLFVILVVNLRNNF